MRGLSVTLIGCRINDLRDAGQEAGSAGCQTDSNRHRYAVTKRPFA